MAEVYLLLGSNEGHRKQHLIQAAHQISVKCGNIIRRSGIYETEAWGMKEQSAFLNQALLLQTYLSPPGLLTRLKNIEREAGRLQTVHWGPRIIDIDILFYGADIIDLPQLKVPHPYLHQRRFTLEPLVEIAPELNHPLLKQSVRELLKVCPDTSDVKMLEAENH